MARPRLLLILLLVLGSLLTYAWVTDRPSPAAPQGQFGDVLVFAASLCVFVLVVALIVRRFRSARRTDDP